MSTPQHTATIDTSIYSYKFPPFYKTRKGMMTIGAGLTIALLIFMLVLRWWRRELPLTLKQWAQREHGALGRELENSPVNYKRYFGLITFFIKQYLHRLYGWKLLDKTDGEVIDVLQEKSELSKDLKTSCAELFSYAQMVKFADQAALEEKAHEALATVARIIETLEAPKPDESTDEAA